MKFLIEVDPETNPDAVGEYLRSRFFDEKMVTPKPYKSCFSGVFQPEPYRETGCYQTFNWHPDVTPLPDLKIHEDHNHPESEEAEDLCWACSGEDEYWKRAELQLADLGEMVQIICSYHWDHDGVLIFDFPDGSKLVNNDCKKDHGWEYYGPGKEMMT